MSDVSGTPGSSSKKKRKSKKKDTPKSGTSSLADHDLSPLQTAQDALATLHFLDAKVVGVNNPPFPEDKHLQQPLLILHPDTAEKLGLALGQLVVVQGSVIEGCVVARMWPCKRVHVNGAGIHPLLYLTGFTLLPRVIDVYAIKTPIPIASRVEALVDCDSKVISSPGVSIAIKQHLKGRAVCSGNVVPVTVYGRASTVQVGAMSCDNPCNVVPAAAPVYTIGGDTHITLRVARTSTTITSGQEEGESKITTATTTTTSTSTTTTTTTPAGKGLHGYGRVGGKHALLREMTELIQLPLTRPHLFTELGVTPPRGVLLFGPPGTGKTLMARAVAEEAGASLHVVNASEVMGKYYGEAEQRLRDIFKKAMDEAPSIIYIDELDALTPKRAHAGDEVTARIVGTFIRLLDNLTPESHIAVLASTNRVTSIDPALRRAGRFDREIELGVPSAVERVEILKKLLQGVRHDVTPEQIEHVAGRAHGFVGADLSAVVKQACLRVFGRVMHGKQQGRSKVSATTTSSSSSSSSGSALVQGVTTSAQEYTLTLLDLEGGFMAVKPSALREIAIEVPKVRWDDIGGQVQTKTLLREAVEWPLAHPEAFQRMHIRPPKGVILYGPPGCSKTMMAKALATESGLNFIAVKGPELFSKWVGESEKAVQEVFRKARVSAPSIVFFDEIDALAVQRGGHDSGHVGDRVLSQLLTELDGIQALKQVVVVAATNRPDLLDAALTRPGRFDRLIYVSPPDQEAREEILRIRCRQMPVDDDVDIPSLAQQLQGYSGAEVTAVCQEAAMCSLRENASATMVSGVHFARALKTVTPRLSPAMIASYERFSKARS